MDTVQNLLRAGQPVDDRLDTLRGGLRGTVAEVRRIVEELRPGAIDDLGLFGAVRELGLQLAEGAGLDLTLDLPDHSPVLPAAVEVAAYRITQEALTNVVRHAGAERCTVVARVTEDALELEVSDDGCGGAQEGVGAGHGQHERARGRDRRSARRTRHGARDDDQPAPPAAGRGVDVMRVLVVDDHPLFRDGLIGLLATVRRRRGRRGCQRRRDRRPTGPRATHLTSC